MGGRMCTTKVNMEKKVVPLPEGRKNKGNIHVLQVLDITVSLIGQVNISIDYN